MSNAHCWLNKDARAAPNLFPIKKYGMEVSEDEIKDTLYSRIEFVLDIVADNNVDTLILGAWGCGVFKQDLTQVVSVFKEYLKKWEGSKFKKILFAVPQSSNNKNYEKFLSVFKE